MDLHAYRQRALRSLASAAAAAASGFTLCADLLRAASPDPAEPEDGEEVQPVAFDPVTPEAAALRADLDRTFTIRHEFQTHDPGVVAQKFRESLEGSVESRLARARRPFGA